MSYISGWLSALGWNSNIAVTAYVTANLITALAGLYTGFEAKNWYRSLPRAVRYLLADFNIGK